MQRKFNGILAISLSIITFSLSAQQNSVSPYSRLGLGDMRLPNYTRGQAMGGATLANYDALFINNTNPASYTALQLTTFELGMYGSFIDQEQANPDLKIENNTAGLSYFAFALPLTDWWGSGVGLQPYSAKGYNISRTRTGPDDIEITDAFSGNGGFNRLYWGNAFEVAKGLSLGIDASYLFGTLEESQTVIWDANRVYIAQFDERVRAGGFKFNYGAQYNLELPKLQTLNMAVTFSNSSNLPIEIESYQYTLDPLRGPVDTAAQEVNERDGNYTLPSELAFGLYYGRKSRLSAHHAWGVSANYTIYNGSEFRNQFGNAELRDAFIAQFGAHLTPALTWEGAAKRGGYLSHIEYRLGGFYERSPISVDGQGIDDYGMTFGMGLPVRQRGLAPGEVKVTTLNLGMKLGRRGTLDNNLIRENYLSLFIGVTLNDKWFIDYKYR